VTTNFDGTQPWPQQPAVGADAGIVNGMRDILSRTYPTIAKKFTDYLALAGGALTGALTFSSAGSLVIPVYAADPASPANGALWYNSTSGTFKCRQNGVTKTFTTS